VQPRCLGHAREQAELSTGAAQAAAGRRKPGLYALIGLLAGCVLSVVLAGCGGTQNKQSATTTTRTSSATAHAAASKPIATVEDTTVGVNQPNRLQVSIYDLRRDGPFLVLDFGLRCLTPSTGCELVDPFAPGYESTSEIVPNGWTPAGIRLVDPTGLKEYLPVRDGEGRPYTSYFSQGDAGLTDSLVHLEWVRYPLPPAGTTALDVALPDAGPVVPNVAITDGSGPTAAGQLQGAQPASFAQAPGSTSTAGLTLPVENLIATSGNPAGSDSESPGRAQLTLQSDVLFRFGKSNLTPKAQAILRSVAQQIKTRARGTVKVTGYTDSIGTDQFNLRLSQARARSVVAALTPLTPGVSYTSQGLGSADPVAPNTKPDGSDNPAGRALNRRVTIVFAAIPARPTPPAPTAIPSGPAGSSGSITFVTPWAGGNDTYRVSDPSLYRDGNLMLLTMTLTCVAGKVGNSCYQAFDLDGLPTVPPQPLFGGPSNSFDVAATRSISGFSLLDPTTGTVYIPVRRTDAVPLTSNLAGDSIPAGDSYRVWIYFGATPSTTSQLTLVSPGAVARLGPVPISSGSPPAP
jgi:outer membrane protein OmpA-like peptidoglycan-associated protein